MSGHAGLVQKKVKVRGKGGKTGQRTMWVKASAAPKGRVRNPGTGKPMTAGTFLKRNALKIAGRAAVTGVASSIGSIAGHHAGHKVAGNLGATIGNIVGGHMAGNAAAKNVYKSKHGQQILSEARRTTRGGRIAAALIHGGVQLGVHTLGLEAHNRLAR